MSLLLVRYACIVVFVGLVVGSSQAASVQWDPMNDATVTGFNLYQAPGACAVPGPFARVATYLGATTVSGAIPNPLANGVYCFKLTAFNDAGESVFSNTVENKFTLFPPAAPRGVTVKP